MSHEGHQIIKFKPYALIPFEQNKNIVTKLCIMHYILSYTNSITPNALILTYF
jgi:hypothetical protein